MHIYVYIQEHCYDVPIKFYLCAQCAEGQTILYKSSLNILNLNIFAKIISEIVLPHRFFFFYILVETKVRSKLFCVMT